MFGLTVQEETAYHGGEGMEAGLWSQCPPISKWRTRRNWCWTIYSTLKPNPSDSPVRLHLLKVLEQTTSWGPRVQTHDSRWLVDVLYSNLNNHFTSTEM